MFITSIVGWSLRVAEANSEAPIRSPAPTIRVLAGVVVSAETASTVVAHAVVAELMRPWKSFTATRLTSTTGAALAGAAVTATTASGAVMSAVVAAPAMNRRPRRDADT